jgi:hypothetical protein
VQAAFPNRHISLEGDANGAPHQDPASYATPTAQGIGKRRNRAKVTFWPLQAF